MPHDVFNVSPPPEILIRQQERASSLSAGCITKVSSSRQRPAVKALQSQSTKLKTTVIDVVVDSNRHAPGIETGRLHFDTYILYYFFFRSCSLFETPRLGM